MSKKNKRLRWNTQMEEHLLYTFQEADKKYATETGKNDKRRQTKNELLLSIWAKTFPEIEVNSRQLWNKYQQLTRKTKQSQNKNVMPTSDVEQVHVSDSVPSCTINLTSDTKCNQMNNATVNQQPDSQISHTCTNDDETITALEDCSYYNMGRMLESVPLFNDLCYNCGMLLYGRVSEGHKFNAPEAYTNNPPVRVLFSDTLLDAAVQHNLQYSCRFCKNKPINFPACANPSTGKQEIPSELQNLSVYEKGKIALSGLFSSTLKKANSHKRIWEHRVGETNILTKTKELYHGMYGFLINKFSESVHSTSKEKIRTALLWLQQNNPLYKSFYSNMETLFSYYKSDITIEADEDVTTRKNEHVSTQLGIDKLGICLPFQDSNPLPKLNPEDDVVGLQHPINATENLTKTHYNDPDLEPKAWPHLFPYGIGGWHYTSPLHVSDYVKMRLLNIDSRWRSDKNWSFFFFDRMIKQRILYTAKSRKVIKDMPWEDLTVGKVRKMYSNKDDTNPYAIYGTSVPITIPGSKGYWSSRLLDLLAMSKEFGTPSFLVTLTQNDNWPELQHYIQKGFKDKFSNSDDKSLLSPVDFPVETVVAFHKRFQNFKKNVLSNKNGPLGNVRNYWYRVEFQKRGAIHIHMVVWCTDIPKNAVSAEIPRTDTPNPFTTYCRRIVQKYQIHGECTPERCFKGSNGQVFENCKYGFPFSIQSQLCLDQSRMRYLYPRSHEEDSRVVPYNLDILLLWGAHINIQKLVDGGWELYCAKYVAKAEPTFDLKLQDASQPEKFLRSRICGRLEVDSTLLGYPLSYSSRDVIFLPTEVKPKYGYLKRAQHLPSDNKSKDVFYDNLYEKYLDRPEQLRHELYPDYFRKYRFINSSEKPKQEILVDGKGRALVRRLEGREVVPRWRYFVPYGDEQEKYFEQKLILSVPFHRENIHSILSEGNISKSYMEECIIRKLFTTETDCIDTLKTAEHRGFSFERISEIAKQLVSCGWLISEKADQFLSDLSDNRPTNETTTTVLDTDLTNEDGLLGVLRPDEKSINLESMISQFSDSQSKAFHFLTNSISNAQTLASVIGSAGTGKSFLINALVAYLQQTCKLTVQKLATTGVAAYLIEGTTVHNFFKMDIECNSYLEKGTPEYQILKDTNVIIIDEFSLMDRKVFQHIDSLCRCVSGGRKLKEPFGGKHVIMVGDPAQLPAIDGDIFCTSLWQNFKIVMLSQCQRQKDELFLQILQEVRLGHLSSASDAILKTRIISDVSEILPDAPVIVSLRKDRDSWNDYFLQQIEGEVFEFPAVDTDGNGNEISQIEKQKIKLYHRERLPDNLILKLGAKVMLVKNINVKEGWVNGTLATVCAIKNDYIFIKNETDGRKLIVSRVKQNLAFKGSTSGIVRQQFPLTLGWALTVHKVQGMTLPKAYIKFDNSFFASGQAYVALSRVKSLPDLHLIQYSQNAIILDPFYKELLQWMETVNLISNVKHSQIPYPSRKAKSIPDPANAEVEVNQTLLPERCEIQREVKKRKRDVSPPLNVMNTCTNFKAQESAELQSYLHPSIRQFYSVKTTPPDGNCLYHAISIGLTGDCSMSTSLRALALETLLKFQELFERHIEREPIQTFDEIVSLALTDRAWCNEYHLQALAIALKRPIFVYTQFGPQSGDFFFPSHTIEQLQTAFQLGLPGTSQHLAYWPLERAERSNNPLTCFFKNQHYSAILSNIPSPPMLVPNQCLFPMATIEE